MKKAKLLNISKHKLTSLIKKADGDLDFLIFLLKEYWKQKEQALTKILDQVKRLNNDPYSAGDEFFDGRNGKK